MTGRDATGEALGKLIFGQATVGYAVLGVRRSVGRDGVWWERHALPVSEPVQWVTAVETMIAHQLIGEVWPFIASRAVLRGIGSAAFRPGRGPEMRGFQGTIAMRWDRVPSDAVALRFAGVGGHLIAAASGQVFGLLPLAEARHLGALTALTREVAEVLAAQPVGYRRSLPVPGVAGAEFITDPAAALVQEPVTAEAIIAAGLRTSRTPGVST